MNIRIELDERQGEDEVVIRCRRLTEEIRQIRDTIAALSPSGQTLTLYKGETEYYLPLSDILFFETEGDKVMAHTREDVYQAKYRLYELEEFDSVRFLRVSKSTIVNVGEIYSLTRSNLSSVSVAAFSDSHKQVFVSRHYAKTLREKMERMHSVQKQECNQKGNEVER